MFVEIKIFDKCLAEIYLTLYLAIRFTFHTWTTIFIADYWRKPSFVILH